MSSVSLMESSSRNKSLEQRDQGWPTLKRQNVEIDLTIILYSLPISAQFRLER